MDDCKDKCISAGMSLMREHDSFKATHKTPILFPVNLRGLVSTDDLKIQHSELAMHVGAAGREILAFFATPNSSYVVYDNGKGCCDFTFGGNTELLTPHLIERMKEIFGYLE